MDPRSLKIAAGILLLTAVGSATYQALRPVRPRALVVTFVPSENNAAMVADFEPMRRHLERELGMPVKVQTATSYAAVIEAMGNGHVDVARLGPNSYVVAERELGDRGVDIEVFANEVRNDGRAGYNSLFLARADSDIRTLADLRGKRVAFVDALSTSGCLMPSYMIFRRTGAMPAAFFAGRPQFLGSHDNVQLAVQAGKIEAGASNSITYERLTRLGKIDPAEVRIVKKSPKLPGIPIVYRSGLDDGLKRRIRKAFLTAHEATGVSALGKFLRYDPAEPADYDSVRNMIDALKLKREQLLD